MRFNDPFPKMHQHVFAPSSEGMSAGPKFEKHCVGWHMNDDPLSKSADAVSEFSKASGKGIDLVHAFGSTIWEIVGEPIKALTDIVATDKLKFRRFKNRLAMAEEAARLLQERNIRSEDMKHIAVGDIVRIAEGSAEEDEEEMQVRWGRLLANALDPRSDTDARRLFSELLTQLSTVEIVFLEVLQRRTKATVGNDPATPYFERWLAFNDDDQLVAVQNLMRLACVAHFPKPINTDMLFIKPAKGAPQPSFPTGTPSFVDRFEFIATLSQIQQNANVASGLSTGVHMKGEPVGDAETLHRSSSHMLCNSFKLTVLGQSLMRACREEQ